MPESAVFVLINGLSLFAELDQLVITPICVKCNLYYLLLMGTDTHEALVISGIVCGLMCTFQGVIRAVNKCLNLLF